MIFASDLLNKTDMKNILSQTSMGIESIEFSISENLDHLDTKLPDYRARMEYYGVTDLILHGPFLDLSPVAFDSRIREVTAYRFAQTYDVALQLNAKKIVFHSGFIPTIYFLEGWAERVAEFWNAFMEDRTEVQVLIENVYDPFPEPIVNVKELVPSDNFKLCFDIGHANCYSNISPLKWAKALGPHIGHVHLHDNHGTRDTHQALGTGTIPVNEILSTISHLAPHATYTIECNTPEDVLSSHHFISTCFF